MHGASMKISSLSLNIYIAKKVHCSH